MDNRPTLCGHEVRRLIVKPDERVVIMIKERLCFEQHARLRRMWTDYWQPGKAPPLLILDGGAELGTVSVGVDEGAAA